MKNTCMSGGDRDVSVQTERRVHSGWNYFDSCVGLHCRTIQKYEIKYWNDTGSSIALKRWLVRSKVVLLKMMKPALTI